MAEEAAKERSECICVAISLASLTVAFGGLLALVIYQHSKEVRQENLHGRYYLGSASAGDDGGGWWSAEEGIHREAGIRKDPPPLPSSQAYLVEPTTQSPKSGLQQAPERRLEAEAAGDAVVIDTLAANGGKHGGGSESKLLEEIEKRVADALGRPAAERGPLTNRLLLGLLGKTPEGRLDQLLVGTASTEASVPATRSTAEHRRMTTAKDGRAARTSAFTMQRSSPRPTAAAATSFTTDSNSAVSGLPSSPTHFPRAANASNATAPAAVGSGRGAASAVSSAMVFVWQSVAGALRQPVELRWLVLAVAVAALGTLAFSAVVAVALVAGRDRHDRSREFSAPAWWRGERPTAAAAASGGGRRRRGHEDWLSLLQSSDDEDDDEVNGDKDEARGFARAAADGRASGLGRRWREQWRRKGSPPPERRDAANEVRAYVQRLRALDSRNDDDDDDDNGAPTGSSREAGSKESTPLAGCARSYEAIASRQRAELMEWRTEASTIK